MWSAGVVLYILLSGYPPFYDDSEPALFDKIRRGDYSFDDPVWDTISDGAKDLVKSLLVVDPAKRLSASGVLKHKWIQSSGANTTTSLAGAQKNLKKNFRSKFRAGVGTVIAMNRMKHALGAPPSRPLLAPPGLGMLCDTLPAREESPLAGDYGREQGGVASAARALAWKRGAAGR